MSNTQNAVCLPDHSYSQFVVDMKDNFVFLSFTQPQAGICLLRSRLSLSSRDNDQTQPPRSSFQLYNEKIPGIFAKQ